MQKRARSVLVLLSVLWALLLIGCDRGPAPTTESSAAAKAESAEPVAAPSIASAPIDPKPAPVLGPKGRGTAPPFLYEVRKDGQTRGYLFGTMHTAVDAVAEIHPIVYEKLDAARVVVFEIDSSTLDPGRIAEVSQLPPGQSAKKKLKPEHWALLMQRIAGFLTPESVLERFKPWVLGTLLTQSMLTKVEPLDEVLVARARAQKKELMFLETIDEQLGIIDRAFDTSVLEDMLKDLPKTEKNTKDMAKFYIEGRAEDLETLLFDADDMKAHPLMYDALLFARNRAWIPKLEPELARGGVFVAVGAAHHMGKNGVVDLLTERGYEIKRVLP